MKTIYLFILLVTTQAVAFAGTKTADASGNWSDASTWDPVGVPTSTDDVVIGLGQTITLDGDYTCASLTINNFAAALGATNSTLTVEAGNTLTVNGNFTLNTTVSGISTGSAELIVLGTANISGNFILTHTLLTLAGSNELTVGSSTESGTLNIAGDLSLSNALLSLLGIPNQVTLGNGVLDVDGSISSTNGTIPLLVSNSIEANDDGDFDGKSKIFKYGGNNIDLESGAISIADADGDTNYEFWYDGVISQTVETDNITYNHLYIKNTSFDVDIEASLTNTLVEGKLYIDAGAKLHLDVTAKNIDALSGSADKINILADGTLKLSPNSYGDGVPPNTVLTSHSDGIIEFYHPTEGVAGFIVQESVDYPIIKLSGPGTKRFGSAFSLDIDDVAPRAGRIWLAEGVFLVDAGMEISTNDSYGSKTIQLDSATTMRIDGDFATLDSYFEIDRDNTVNYYGNTTQEVYEITRDGSSFEPYGILRFERTAGSSVVRNVLSSDTILVANRMEIEDEIDLILNQSSYAQFLSNTNYSAYVTEIASSANITYSGSPAGEFGIQKYLPLPYRAYRDLTSPIQGTTLQSWQDAGLDMKGFSGSNTPGAGRNTVNYYDETVLNELNIGFQDATNISNAVHTYDGSDFELSAWRIYDGNNGDTTYSITLEDNGEIFTGNQTYKLKFTYSNYDGSSRENHDGWNHLGNPYAAPLNWNDIYNDPANATLKSNNYIGSSMYILGQIDRYWANNNGYYGFYNAATETGFIHDSLVPAYQGFWVKAYHPSNANEEYTLTIKESHKYNKEESFYYKNNTPKKGKKIEDVALKIKLNTGRTENVAWLQPFKDASLFKDKNYDVPKFGDVNNMPFAVDFIQDTTWLNLLVNAFDDTFSKNTEMRLGLKSNRSGDHFLTFENLDAITNNHCVVLKNTITNEITFIKDGEPILVDLTEGINTQYVLLFNNDYQLNTGTQNPTCFGEKGKIQISGDEIFHSNQWQFVLNDEIVATIPLTEGGIQINAGAGTYKITNKSGLAGCGVKELTLTIAEGPRVFPNFDHDAGDTTEVGKTVQFFAQQENNDAYTWVIENTEYTSDAPEHRFEETGLKTILLTTQINNCVKSDSSNIYVQETPTSIIENNGFTENFWIKNKTLYWSNYVNNITVYTEDGKLLNTYTNRNQIPLENGLHFYCLNDQCLKIFVNLNQ